MMDDECRRVQEQLQVFLDSECPGNITRTVNEHLQQCSRCTHRADFERHLREMVATCCRDAAPPGLVDRVLSRLAELG